MASSAKSFVDQLFAVEGKTALVTGASSGIGRELSIALSKAGCSVIVAARRLERLEELVQEINQAGEGRAKAVKMDVLEADNIEEGLASTWSEFGRIDILVNNAAVFAMGPAVETKEDDYDRLFGTNLRGLWLVTRAVAKRQVADGGGGSIINIAGFNADNVCFHLGPASSIKAGVVTLTKHLARELAPSNIRVNAISPGIFAPSEISGPVLSIPPIAERLNRVVPMGRHGDSTKELSGALLLLASDAGAYITGTNILVDGGYNLATPDWISDPRV